MLNLINDYLKTKKNVWSKSTLRTTASRLKSNHHLLKVTPYKALNQLLNEGKSKYGIKTLFITIAMFEEWCLKQGILSQGAPYSNFLKENKSAFKGCYNKEIIDKSFDKVRLQIRNIKDIDIRNTALFILHTGLRIHEVNKVDKQGYVIGKGARKRKVFEAPPKVTVVDHRLRSELKNLGLKPHSLRKLFATKLVNKGLPLQDVCKVMGWSSIETAMCYLQPSNEKALGNKISEVING